MEADQENQNLSQRKLLENWDSHLSERMGKDNWLKRKTKEFSLHPIRGISSTRFLKESVHNCAAIILYVLLTVFRKRKTAVSNCGKTTLTRHKLAVVPKHSSVPSALRILHLSDLHLDSRLEQRFKWIEIVEQLKNNYDFAVITGDYFNTCCVPNEEMKRVLKEIIDSINKPIWGILGNHDSAAMVPILESMGVKMLLNESDHIDVNNTQIQITGVDDPHFYESDDLDHALAGIPTEQTPDFKLLLVHAPKNPSSYAAKGFDLCLAGHTHGGQICSTAGTPLLRNGSYDTEHISGWWKQEKTKGYTSRGTGTGRLHYRINCPPEIALHEITVAGT